MSNGHDRIKNRTETSVRAALNRLVNGKARHPQHLGERVPICISSVVREAGIGRTTLYRYQHLIEEIEAARSTYKTGEPSKRAERRTRQTVVIRELQRQISELLERNLELTMRLSKVDSGSKVTPMHRPSLHENGNIEQLEEAGYE